MTTSIVVTEIYLTYEELVHHEELRTAYLDTRTVKHKMRQLITPYGEFLLEITIYGTEEKRSGTTPDYRRNSTET